MTSRNRNRNWNRVRSASVRSTGLISLESLESRRLLSGEPANIVWVNRGGPADTDGFGATFGTSAPAARAVVDAAILAWERVIGSFNFSDGRDYLLNVSMSNVGNSLFRTVCNATWQFEGKPSQGEMVIGKGRPGADPNDDNDWFLDPTPNDNSEFDGFLVNAFTGDASVSSPAFNKVDLYSSVVGELTHGMGMMGDSLIGWRSKTIDTGAPDTAEGGGVGNFWTFNGPSIRHLLTSNIDGPTGGDSGQPAHTAGPGVDVQWGAFTYKGAQDLGNAVYASSQRNLVSETFALMFKDAYGYSTTNAAASGSFYSNLSQSTGVLTVRGGDFGYVANNSSDSITISRSGSVITVSVDIGNDVPGTGALPGDGNLPAWVSHYDISQISSITIDAGAGSDTITISGPVGVPITVNSGDGDDAVNVSAQLGAPVTVQGGAGADVVNFNEPGLPQPTMIAQSWGFSSGATTVTFAGGIEASIMTGNANPVQMVAFATAPNRPLLIFGSSANEQISLNSTTAANFPAYVQVNGGGGFDTLDVADGPIVGGTSVYSINGSSVVKNNGFAGLNYADVDRVSIIGETGPNQFDVVTGSQCPVHLDGRESQDVYNVLNTGTNAPVVIESAFGNDTLNVNLDNVGQGLAQTSGNQTFGAINIGDAGRLDVLAGTNSTVTTGSLTLGTTLTSLNLYDNDLIVDYTGASQLAAVQAMINSARANGWVTNGLTSWTARDNPQHNTTLGAMEATEYKSIYGAGATFNGRPIDNTAVLVKYTYYGDADFSGTVDFDDYVQTDAGFNNGRSGWMNGDFDGNGGVDFDDYVLIDLGLNSQGAPL